VLSEPLGVLGEAIPVERLDRFDDEGATSTLNTTNACSRLHARQPACQSSGGCR
jgi:hypothetical protein